MGKFKEARSPQEQLWALVEETNESLLQDGVDLEKVTSIIDKLIRLYAADANDIKQCESQAAPWTPLALALERGAAKRAMFLAIVQCEAFQFTRTTGSAVVVAVKQRSYDDAYLILRRQLPTGPSAAFLNLAYEHAVYNGDFKIADLLLDHGADPAIVPDTVLLQQAIKFKHVMLIRAILAAPDLLLSRQIVDMVVAMLNQNLFEFNKVIPNNRKEFFQQCLGNPDTLTAYQTSLSRSLEANQNDFNDVVKLPETKSETFSLEDLIRRAAVNIVAKKDPQGQAPSAVEEFTTKLLSMMKNNK